MQKITGKDNTRVKLLLKAVKDPVRTGLIFVEGIRSVNDAFLSGQIFESLYVTEERISDIIPELLTASDDTFLITDEIASKVSQTVNTQGVFGLVRIPESFFSGPEEMTGCERLMVCDGVSDPGNMGNIIRSADAFGFDGVLLSRDCVSPFNEKVIRASAGSVFHVKIYESASITDDLERLKTSGFTIYSSALKGTELRRGYRFRMPFGIVIGNEGNGVSDAVLNISDEIIRIPMTGKAESLNAASAATVLAFLSMNV